MTRDDDEIQAVAMRAIQLRAVRPAHFDALVGMAAVMYDVPPREVVAWIEAASRGEVNRAFGQAPTREGCSTA